jgi:hypothetical protein
MTMVDGLWANTRDALVADFATVVWRMKLLGINAVRLPFSFLEFSKTPQSIVWPSCGAIDPNRVRSNVIPPGMNVPSSAVPPPLPTAANISRTSGVCNQYVSSQTTRGRLLWVTKFLADNGFYVILDDHLVRDGREKEKRRETGEGREARGKKWGENSPPPQKKQKNVLLSSNKPQVYDTYVLSDPIGWAKGWGSLAADVAADPVMKNRVMFDLMNEPDGRGIGWTTVRIFFSLFSFLVSKVEGCDEGASNKDASLFGSVGNEKATEPFAAAAAFRGRNERTSLSQPLSSLFLSLSPSSLFLSLSLSSLFLSLSLSLSLHIHHQGPGKGNYGATALFLMAMEEIYKVNPTGLVLIEGSGQPGTQMSWGDGFASEPAVVGSGQSAAPFFEAVMSKPYAANVVLSPHVYPSSVFDNHNPAVTTGPPLWMRMTNSYGYLTKRGFCASADTERKACRTFPVIFGETGSFFAAQSDLSMLEDFARYMQTDDAEHNKVPNMLFW